jgi:hypothetical protein
MSSKGPFGEGIHAQDPKRLAVQVESQQHSFDHRGARSDAPLHAELAVEVLGEASGAAHDLMGRPSHDGFRAAPESSARGGRGDVDRHDHRHPERHAQDHQTGVQGPTGEVAQADAEERRLEHHRARGTKHPSWIASTRSARAATSPL